MILIKKTMPWVIILGLIALLIAWYFNLDNQLIGNIDINGIKMYTLDLNKYFKNIQNVWEISPVIMSDLFPTREWQTTNANMFQQEFWNAFINDIAIVFDYLYMPLNLVCYIIRWISWVDMLLMAIVGWPIIQTGQTNGINIYSSQIITVLMWIKEHLYIPYI